MAEKITDSLIAPNSPNHFSPEDLLAIEKHGISVHELERHLQIHRSGVPKLILNRHASIGDGILNLSDSETHRLSLLYNALKNRYKVQKFVPASGAASRMFKFLTEFMNELDPENESINAYINRKNATDLTVFLAGMEKFPFFEAIDAKLRADFPDFESWHRERKNLQFIKMMLTDPSFDYANKPKAVLPFHKYHDHIATPLEEHLYEAVAYAGTNGVAKLHFTVSDNHQKLFEKIIADKRAKIEHTSQISFEIEYSWQEPSTDTIAVEAGGTPFRNDDGILVFRPSGHGALLSNLNRLDADLVYIKNIDNVVQDHVETIGKYKMALAGLLLELREQAFSYLKQIDTQPTTAPIDEMAVFLQQKLNIQLGADFNILKNEHQLTQIHHLLNRPIRICGMVKNEGEPGGGPFWVDDGSLQIVESTQVDMNDAAQIAIMKKATHFNPVDLVCGIRDYRGIKFDLHQFTNPDTGFIVSKSKNGKNYHAYELPGLWNGAMANWITVFAEVPLITFNPVKTVNDLLKPTHQPQ